MRLRGWVRPREKRDRLSEVELLGERYREQRDKLGESWRLGENERMSYIKILRDPG